MNNLIKYKEDCKKIIDIFDNLLPWDKAELIKYLSDYVMTFDEIEEYFIKGLGYIKYDDIDFVDEIFDNNLEYDVLDQMTDNDLIYYISRLNNKEYLLKNIFKDYPIEDKETFLVSLNDEELIELIERIKDKKPEIFE